MFYVHGEIRWSEVVLQYCTLHFTLINTPSINLEITKEFVKFLKIFKDYLNVFLIWTLLKSSILKILPYRKMFSYLYNCE